MKKSTIWMFAIIMTIAFFGLMYLQITYFKSFVMMRNGQFNENVNRSLYQISKNVEKTQTIKYLNQAFLEHQKTEQTYSGSRSYAIAGKVHSKTITKNIKVTAPDAMELSIEESSTSTIETQTVPVKPIFQSPNRRGTNAISRMSYDMLEDQKKRFLYESDNLNEVISQILRTASNAPIEERVNVRNIENEIRYELKQNGIELPFQFEIVDKNDKPIYRQARFVEENKGAVYSQILFPNDPADKSTSLKIYFSTKNDYLMSEAYPLIPAFMFTMILLLTFIIIMYITLRQKRLSEMKNDFMNNMTHELKTPVSTISLAAQMLKDGSIIKSPDAFKHISGVINDETERLSFQVEKVLQMSLFEKEQAALALRLLDANDIVVHVASTFQLKVEKFGGEIDIDLQATESTINADKMHFTNVLFNLLDNAVKYRREDTDLKLMIRTWNQGNKLLVSVEDNGIGMRKDSLKKIFDRFYRVSTGNRHDVKGFGLGLAYVKKIIEDHKGTIKAESELNKGTKFIITMPIQTERK